MSRADHSVLWHVWDYRSQEYHRSGEPWWWLNQPRSPDDAVVVQMVHHGRMILRTEETDLAVGPGQAFLFCFDSPTAYGRPPDHLDWSGWSDDLWTSFVSLRGAGLRAHWQDFIARWGAVITLPPGAEATIFHGGRLADARLVDPLSAAQESARIMTAVARAWSMAAVADRTPVEAAIAVLRDDPWIDQPLKDLAARCGCSREYFCRMFQAQVGESPSAWQRRRRQERALELLRDTDLSLADVAKQSGAGNFHRLARWTRAELGLPPEQARVHLRHRGTNTQRHPLELDPDGMAVELLSAPRRRTPRSRRR